ncbi:hypothetical protein NXF25_017984 [Crotalus adamanteus]|uniref:Ig-like domain-containing protein n=1 Tax=Crotalus adamanteus TaxID=8729 RepID=A0AAW1ANT2_CROAD
MTQPFLFLLFLLTYFTGASTQFTMTQPPSVSASRGQTVQLTCTREGGSISSYYRGGVEARGKSICFREGIGPSSCPTMTQVLLLAIVLISVGPSLQQLQTLKDPEFVAVGQTVTLSCRTFLAKVDHGLGGGLPCAPHLLHRHRCSVHLDSASLQLRLPAWNHYTLLLNSEY